MAKQTKTNSKLQGINRMAVDATIELTDLVEKMHNRIVHPPFLPSTPVQHLITNISSIIYKNIRWGTKLMGNGADKALRQFAPYLSDIKSTQQREAIHSVLNGLVGDYLKRTDNPLQIEMEFRHEGNSIKLTKKGIKKAYPVITSKLLLLVHGSCMNDLNWTKEERNHGLDLAQELNKTPIFLKYNSGLHVSTNGKLLATELESLITNWPVTVSEITLVAHSMGGLVARSALHYGQKEQKTWVKKLKKVMFLGTPHHGASLEKAGNVVEVILKAIPYAKPFARLAKIRGAGVTDLRYGNILDEDWKDIDQHKLKGDKRNVVPLPDEVAFYCIAATTSKPKKSRATRMMSDTLVSVKSALGKHRSKKKTLHFQEENTKVIYQNNHTDLLNSPLVYDQLKAWFSK